MSDDLPFRAEYAKSGRASCKGCKGPISKDVLRLAVMIQSPRFDGKVPNWYHFSCFFGKNRIKTVGDIAHFDQLRWEDQEKIKEKVAGSGAETLKKQTEASGELADFKTEYAKSNRSTCRECSQKIEKGILRIARKDYDAEGANFYGPQDYWYHADCFAKNRKEYDFFASASKLTGFTALKKEDQEMLLKKLPQLKSADAHKRAGEITTKESKKAKKESADEKKLMEQNKLIFKYRDQLQKEVSKKDMQYLLEHNNQDIPSGESSLLDRISDGMVFGALLPCPECETGQLVYQREGYKCHGNLTEWTTCTYLTKEPKRKDFQIPNDLKEKYTFLKSYKCKQQERFFHTEESLPTSSKSSTVTSSSDLPLHNMKFVIIGKLKKPKSEIIKAVENFGGKVVSKIESSIAACISTEGEVSKMSKKILEAKEANIQVVSEDFLNAVKNGGAVLLITQKSICDWGSDPLDRISDVVDSKTSKKSKSESKESRYTKSIPNKMKMMVKGGAAVDPDSELEEIAHVLEEKGTIYNAVLGLVDVTRGTNSYYKLQILQADKGHRCWLFRSWGRVGTTIGGNKVEDMDSRQEAIESFCALYEEKTGNPWANRNNFVKYPKKFYPLDIDYGQDDEKIKKLSDLQATTKSKLHKAVQDLICMIFDVEAMKNTMVEFEIDLKKMPLGKLSRRQIESAYTILTELQQLIQSGGSAPKFLDASNRFYTLIPHDFGLKKPTPLDNEDLIKQKIDMLDSLLEIEVAYNLLKDANDDKTQDPLDAYYQKLKTDIEVIDNSSEEFKIIDKYIKNTHAATHNQYDLEILDAYKIKRKGEEKRYKPFKQLPNRQLLWHGSRVTNFVGILSQGLRIAPPEAPVTGYMFGKGVYFADMVSKSANYCNTSKSNPIGILLLCEVALGNMHELTKADFITKLPPGKNSTKGIGRTHPDPSQKVVLNGVEIPLGKAVDAKVSNTSLLYNEYIIYDVAQVNIKYLLKMKFNWKY